MLKLEQVVGPTLLALLPGFLFVEKLKTRLWGLEFETAGPYDNWKPL